MSSAPKPKISTNEHPVFSIIVWRIEMSVSKVLKMIKDKEVKFVDLRFTDTKGKWQHTAQTSTTIDENAFKEGIMFDGSSM